MTEGGPIKDRDLPLCAFAEGEKTQPFSIADTLELPRFGLRSGSLRQACQISESERLQIRPKRITNGYTVIKLQAK